MTAAAVTMTIRRAMTWSFACPCRSRRSISDDVAAGASVLPPTPKSLHNPAQGCGAAEHPGERCVYSATNLVGLHWSPRVQPFQRCLIEAHFSPEARRHAVTLGYDI